MNTKLVVPPMPEVYTEADTEAQLDAVRVYRLDELRAYVRLGWQTAQREAALADELAREMERYLPVLEKMERIPLLWGGCIDGTGIATLNGYRHVIAKHKEARNEGR